MSHNYQPSDILHFWFKQAGPERWWKQDAEFDQYIHQHFSALHRQASAGELYLWRQTAQGCLAEIIILDQFSRNLFRQSAQAYACDGMALVLAQQAVAKELDKQLPKQQRCFIYMPYMHSESLLIHDVAISLFNRLAMPEQIDFEQRHYQLIKRFGRYPQRNKALGRASSDEETAFLQQTDIGF